MTDDACSALVLGSGPAGLFAADNLLRAGVPDVVVVESGRAMPGRICPDGPRCDCRICDVLEGEGGAGSFSDGKITLSPTRGTHGRRLFRPEQEALLGEVESTIRRHVPAGNDYRPVAELSAIDGHQDTLRGESYPLLHVGSDGVREFGRRYVEDLRARGVTLLAGTEVVDLVIEDGRVRGATVRPRRGEPRTIAAPVVVAAVGMTGTLWLESRLRAAGVRLETGPADIGIRVETSAAALDPLISEFYDFKVSHTNAAGFTLRSFCVNGRGFVVNEYHQRLGIRGVNGHSFLDRQSTQSNLAVLATVDERFVPDPQEFVRALARTVNAGSQGYPTRQTLADFRPALARGRPAGVIPSNPKTRPGRLDALLPPALADAFADYIAALAEALPPLGAPDTTLYAPEIKYYNYRVPIDPDSWESLDVRGLYVVGNASGHTASLSAAALAGIIAGRAAAASLATHTR